MTGNEAVVLLVDDDEAKRYLMRTWLHRAGHTVIEAGTGREALDRAASAELVLLDVNLPDMLGYEVCRQLKSQAVIAAFEPLTEAADIYRALFSTDGRVSLHVCALARERGEMTMHVSARDDSSSLLPISSAQIENFPGTESVGVRSVPAAISRHAASASSFFFT